MSAVAAAEQLVSDLRHDLSLTHDRESHIRAAARLAQAERLLALITSSFV